MRIRHRAMVADAINERRPPQRATKGKVIIPVETCLIEGTLVMKIVASTIPITAFTRDEAGGDQRTTLLITLPADRERNLTFSCRHSVSRSSDVKLDGEQLKQW
jgi:hypothetical protein